MTSKYASGQFWIDTFDRAAATFAQAFGALLVADKVTTLMDMDLAQLAGTAGITALASVLTSVAFRGGAPGATAPAANTTAR